MTTGFGAAGAPWRERFTASQRSLPAWARHTPHRAIFRSNESGKWEIYTWDVGTDECLQLTDRPAGTSSAAISLTGEDVWWWADEKGGESGRWMRQPFDGRDAEPAVPAVPPAFPAGLSLGSRLAVIGTSDRNGHRIYLCEDGDASVVYESPHAAYVAGLSYDDTLIALWHAEHGDARSLAARVVDAAGNTVAEQWDGKGNELHPGPWSPRAGDQRLLIFRTRSGRSLPAVWHVDTGLLADMEIGLSGEIVAADWDPGASSIVLLRAERGRVDAHRLDLATGRTRPLGLERGNVSALRVRPDGEVWYAVVRSSHAPEVRALGTNGASRTLLSVDRRAPPGVAYGDLDVGPIHSFVARPAGAGPFPTIFIAHGGPEAHDSDTFNPAVQAWVDHGILVVLTNYRGSTGYGKDWQHAIVGRPGFKALEDLATVHDELIESGLCDRGRTILSGPSWGGYLTLLGLGTQPDRWALGISSVPMADLVQNYRDESESLRQYDRSLWGGTPDELPDVWRETSPLTYAANVRAPLLIVAGLNDPRSPIEQIRNYTRRLDELGKIYETHLYDAGHGSLRTDDRIRQFEVMHEFARRMLR